MKTFIKSFKLTLAFCAFSGLFYILTLWVFTLLAGPNDGLLPPALMCKLKE